MAIRMTPKLVSAQPAKERAIPREKPVKAIAAPDTQKGRGRPPSGKVRVTMLLKPETVEKFKATGKGWQARMSDILDRNAP